MSGHSKWATIKRKKEEIDQKRSSIFQKLSKEIYVAAKSGDKNPLNNAALRLCVEKAKACNMPNDKIQKAIDKANNNSANENYDEILYEGYGPSGVAVMVNCLTDNKNRTASLVRSTFTKKNGNLGTSNSVSYMFNRKGVIIFESDIDEEILMDSALSNNALDFSSTSDGYEIQTNPEDFIKMKEAMEKLGVKHFIVSEVTFVPNLTVKVENEEEYNKIMSLIDTLEEIEDVQSVYHNLEG